MELREKIARILHGNLFATITDWREEVCSWEELPAGPKREFLYVAEQALAAATEDDPPPLTNKQYRTLLDNAKLRAPREGDAQA